MRLLHNPAINNYSDTANLNDCISIGVGLPPISAKLVSKIEAGEYIDMAELIPDRLGVARSFSNEESGKVAKQKRRIVATIMERVQSQAAP